MCIEIWTDGGCHGNPGPGAWAFIIVENNGEPEDKQKILAEKCGAEKLTTNNRMELSAVIAALETLPSVKNQTGNETPVTVWTDSEYVKNGITVWIQNWKARAWRTSAKKPVKNEDLWRKLDALAAREKILWKWVKGHNGTFFNERCDKLTQIAIAEL